MRLEPLQRVFTVTPGRPFDVELEVFNTADVIDGISARVIGLDPSWVMAQPLQLALFPQTSGRIKLHLSIPPEFPAGQHVITVETVSSVPGGLPAHAELTLNVEQICQAELVLAPSMVTARHETHFDVVCDNTGNTPLHLALNARDPDRTVRFEALERTLDVPPGATVTTQLRVSAKRRIFGTDLTHPVIVIAESPEAQIELEAVGVFTQRPLVPRGPITFGILAAIVGLWALAMLFGLGRVLNGDPLTKAVPASFFASTAGAGSAVPAGAIPKQGGAAAVGGQISGTVHAKNTGKGVGRITVQAVRAGRSGPVIVASAATGDDGAYTIEGLLPGTYKLHFLAEGYTDVWYPAASSLTGAQPVQVAAQANAKGVDTTIDGQAGVITGTVNAGETANAVPVSISVKPAQGTGPPLSASTATAAGGTGTFTVPDVPTPGTYELSFTAPGYQPTTVTEQLLGGQTLVTNTVRLSAGSGTITGVITDGTNALGGVTVTASSGDLNVSTATPTVGQVGQFTLTNLPTPGTFLLTFVKAGYGSQTIAVDLSAGQSRNDLSVVLAGGTGTISGQVADQGGAPLGNVTVTVNGGATPAVAHTFTSGQVGSYVVAGLTAPGSYTVTFSLDGYQGQTVAVNLPPTGAATGVNGTLTSTVGSLSGQVVDQGTGNGVPNATVSISNGSTVQTSQTVSSPTPGAFLVPNIPAGRYAVTFSATGYTNRTVMVTITAGANQVQNVSLVAGP